MAPPPVVTGISPKEGPPGTRVTIRGEFLGNDVNDLIGLKICGCECLLSAEWKSKNKIVARSGPCKGRGDIIVTTRLGGEGTSTVQFRGYHETVGPVKESAVWVEETVPPALPWGRRPMSPASYTPPDPLGLSTEGDDCKFPEEDLNELFPNGSGNMADENFEPGWYLLEHHSNTSYEDLKAGMVFLQRKVESQKEGQLSFLKANTGAVMDQLDRLVLLKNLFEEDQRKNGKEPLPSLQAAIEESITLADSLFSEILSRKGHADRTREALSLLTRHKFLFQLPASIDRNIRRKEYDLVVNDYQRVKNLFGNTEVKLFQKILAEIDKKIEDLKIKLHERMKTMPISIQEQRKFINLLVSLNWEGDASWEAVISRKDYLIQLLNKVKDHFKQMEELESRVEDKGKRRTRGSSEPAGSGGGAGGGRGAGVRREQWCGAASGVLAEQLAALWTAGRWYFAGDLPAPPAAAAASARHDDFKAMIIAAVQLFSDHMRMCLISEVGGTGSNAGGGADAGSSPEVTRKRLVSNLRSLREAYDTLIKLDLPSQPLAIVERVIYVYRAHGAALFLGRALRRVRALAAAAAVDAARVRDFTQYGAVTDLPYLLESYMEEALSSISSCVSVGGRRETPLYSGAGGAGASSGAGVDPTTELHTYTQRILLAYVDVLHTALQNSDQNFSSGSLSVALDQRLEETLPGRVGGPGGLGGRRPTWQQRLLMAGTNSQYTRRVVLDNIANMFQSHDLPKPTAAIQATKEALTNLESNIAETYLEHKGDPLVGTIEPSMYMGRHNIDPDAIVEDARPYVYEIINNLIAVHAEVDSVCGAASTRYVRDICETVCEELARLAADPPPPRPPSRAAAFRARLELRALRAAARRHLTPAAEKHLEDVLATLPPLENEHEIKRMESLVEDFKKRMALQIASLNSVPSETV